MRVIWNYFSTFNPIQLTSLLINCNAGTGTIILIYSSSFSSASCQCEHLPRLLSIHPYFSGLCREWIVLRDRRRMKLSYYSLQLIFFLPSHHHLNLCNIRNNNVQIFIGHHHPQGLVDTNEGLTKSFLAKLLPSFHIFPGHLWSRRKYRYILMRLLFERGSERKGF